MKFLWEQQYMVKNSDKFELRKWLHSDVACGCDLTSVSDDLVISIILLVLLSIYLTFFNLPCPTATATTTA